MQQHLKEVEQKRYELQQRLALPLAVEQKRIELLQRLDGPIHQNTTEVQIANVTEALLAAEARRANLASAFCFKSVTV